MQTYGGLYAFSSIPSEHRHQRFKRDLRITFQGWKYKAPLRCKGYLKRVIELDALDQGLRSLKRRRLDPEGPICKPTFSGMKKN